MDLWIRQLMRYLKRATFTRTRYLCHRKRNFLQARELTRNGSTAGSSISGMPTLRYGRRWCKASIRQVISFGSLREHCFTYSAAKHRKLQTNVGSLRYLNTRRIGPSARYLAAHYNYILRFSHVSRLVCSLLQGGRNCGYSRSTE